jgi:hypothetical protein
MKGGGGGDNDDNEEDEEEEEDLSVLPVSLRVIPVLN